MKIGTNIKKLRRDRDITQEQLADYLNISVSAISQWESGKTTPDISLLAPLANIFDVTSDNLLGIDIMVKENRIKDIINQAEEAGEYGSVDYEKAAEILRAGLKEYPNSYEIMVELMSCVRTIRYIDKGKEKEEAIPLLNEVIILGERILAECTNDSFRHRAILELCPAYSDPVIGKTDKALELAEKMPYLSWGREFLLAGIYKDEKRLKQMQQNMSQCLISLVATMNNFICDIFVTGKSGIYNDYTLEDRIALCKKLITLIETMFENGDYESYGQFMSRMSVYIAESYIKLNDFENAIKALQSSAEYAIKFDTEHNPDNIKSSLLFKNRTPGYIIMNTKENAVMSVLESMKYDIFDSIRENADFIAIEERLKKMA